MSSDSHNTSSLSSSSGYEEFSEGFSPDEDQDLSTQHTSGQSTQPTSPSLTSKESDTPKKLPPKFVRICPHYTLSFAQLHLMATTPPRVEGRSLDMFAKLHAPHYRQFMHGAEPSIYSHLYFSNALRLPPGFELSSSWEIWCSRSEETNYSVDSIRDLLQTSNVWLCPHIALGSNWVVSTIYRLLKNDNRNFESNDGSTEYCPACRTFLQVTCLTQMPLTQSKARIIVNTKRRLGLGLREDDDNWQKQSVSVAGDRGSGSESVIQRGFGCGVQSLRVIINNLPACPAENVYKVAVGTPGESS